MIQTERLKAVIADKGMTSQQVAWQLGMSTGCFERKLHHGKFGTAEIQDLVELLDIHNPERVFFG